MFRILATALCMAVVIAVSTPLHSQTGGKDPKKKDVKKKDNDQSQYLKQLEARFRDWDDNKDDTLNKAELAKAFRGPKAKPYDAPPDFKTQVQATNAAVAVVPPAGAAPERKIRSGHVALVSLPRHSLFGNVILAELLSTPPPPPTPKPTTTAKPPVVITPNYMAFPDYQFLMIVSKNKDGTISHQEFTNWAKNYAKLLDDVDNAQEELKTAQNKFQNAKAKQAKLQAQKELQKQQQELRTANARLDTIPPAIQKALKVRP